MRDLKHWQERAAHGTSGDMVMDILQDWKQDIEHLKAEITGLRSTWNPPEDKPAEQDAKLGWPNLFPPEDKT